MGPRQTGTKASFMGAFVFFSDVPKIIQFNTDIDLECITDINSICYQFI